MKHSPFFQIVSMLMGSFMELESEQNGLDSQMIKFD